MPESEGAPRGPVAEQDLLVRQAVGASPLASQARLPGPPAVASPSRAAARRHGLGTARSTLKRNAPFLALVGVLGTLTGVLFGTNLLGRLMDDPPPLSLSDAATGVSAAPAPTSSQLQLKDGTSQAVPSTGLSISCRFFELNGEPYGELHVIASDGTLQSAALHALQLTPLHIRDRLSDFTIMLDAVDYADRTASVTVVPTSVPP